MTEQNEMNPAVPAPYVEVANQVVQQVDTGEVNIQDSIIGVVRAGEDAKVENSIASAIVAGKNTRLEATVSSVVIAGGNIETEASCSVVMIAGGNVDLHEGSGGLINCTQANIENSRVGVLLASQVNAGDNVQVLMTQKQAIAFGAAFGLVAAVIGLIFRRRR